MSGLLKYIEDLDVSPRIRHALIRGYLSGAFKTVEELHIDFESGRLLALRGISVLSYEKIGNAMGLKIKNIEPVKLKRVEPLKAQNANIRGVCKDCGVHVEGSCLRCPSCKEIRKRDYKKSEHYKNWQREYNKRYYASKKGIPRSKPIMGRRTRHLSDVQVGNYNKLLQMIVEYKAKHGYPPTMRELQELTGISSTSVVSMYLNTLARLGRIRRDKNISRGIVVLDPQPTKVEEY